MEEIDAWPHHFIISIMIMYVLEYCDLPIRSNSLNDAWNPDLSNKPLSSKSHLLYFHHSYVCTIQDLSLVPHPSLLMSFQSSHCPEFLSHQWIVDCSRFSQPFQYGHSPNLLRINNAEMVLCDKISGINQSINLFDLFNTSKYSDILDKYFIHTYNICWDCPMSSLSFSIIRPVYKVTCSPYKLASFILVK